MRKFILLIILLLIFIPIKINALEDSFYEGEYVPNTYIKKFKGNNGKYEQMRVFRRNQDNRIVYCLELWKTMNSNKIITGYDNNQDSVLGIGDATWRRVMLLAYYGYGYDNHTDIKWYAITQFMIWETLEPNSTIYFTDTLNGNRVDKYKEEMDEINNLVDRHLLTPSIMETINVICGVNYSLVDNRRIINQYDVYPSEGVNIVSREDNRITFNVTRNSQANIELIKTDKTYSNQPIVYIDNNGQNLLLPGSFTPMKQTVNLPLKTKNVIINKLDYDTNSTIPQGEASLIGSEFEIYDCYHNYMYNKVVDENNQFVLNDVGYCQFYLKEIKAGTGYVLNDKEIIIGVGENTNTIDITNKVIKNKIVINKYLKNLDNSTEIEEAEFIILNNKLEEVKSFITENGTYETELPYGIYTIKQRTGKDNYKFTEDFEIDVKEDNITQEFNLYDEEIEQEIEEPLDEIGDITEPIIEIEEKEIIYDIPNTYSKSNMFNIFNFFSIISIFLIKKGKPNEEN